MSYQSETSADRYRFRIRSDRSALAGLPADDGRFPVANWFRNRFSRPPIKRMEPSLGHALLTLDPSRPSAEEVAESVYRLETQDRQGHADWVEHVREAVPGITDITTDGHPRGQGRRLVLKCRNGLELPWWQASNGTMRALSLTLLAYSKDRYETYLIAEPENGIHPYAIEVVFQSLRSVYGSQVLLTTHSLSLRGLPSRQSSCASARIKRELRKSSRPATIRCSRTGWTQSISAPCSPAGSRDDRSLVPLFIGRHPPILSRSMRPWGWASGLSRNCPARPRLVLRSGTPEIPTRQSACNQSTWRFVGRHCA